VKKKNKNEKNDRKPITPSVSEWDITYGKDVGTKLWGRLHAKTAERKNYCKVYNKNPTDNEKKHPAAGMKHTFTH